MMSHLLICLVVLGPFLPVLHAGNVTSNIFSKMRKISLDQPLSGFINNMLFRTVDPLAMHILDLREMWEECYFYLDVKYNAPLKGKNVRERQNWHTYELHITKNTT